MSLYIGTAIGLLIFGIVSILSIGIYFIFVALVMLSVAWAWSRRPWIVAGTVAGAVVAVAVHVLTAPLSCTVTAWGGSYGSGESAFCSRIALPDVRGLDTTGANALALALAIVVGLVVGVIVGRTTRQRRLETA